MCVCICVCVCVCVCDVEKLFERRKGVKKSKALEEEVLSEGASLLKAPNIRLVNASWPLACVTDHVMQSSFI